MFSVEDGIDSYEIRIADTTHPSVFEPLELDDMEMSRLVVESLLTEELRERMRIWFDHHDAYLDFHGGVLFLMALDVCNASVSFDIEGAQDKLDERIANEFPGESLTEFMATAQKYVKVMQSGYALPIRMGSKLLIKCTKTECEFFNLKAYDYLDLVKTMEAGFKLSDPKSMTNKCDYSNLVPIGVITWVQKEHSKFIRDHKWPALASKLPERNNAMI
jgi:hypothetical protein